MERLKNITIIFLLSAFGLLTPVAQAKSPSMLLQEGFYAEEMEGDIKKAIEVYKKVINNKSADETQLAQAMYRLGMCYIKKGNQSNAKTVFEKLVTQYPEQTSIVNKAKALLTEMDGYDPAVLMPPDTKIYIELGSPGRQIEIILNMLKGTPFENPLAMIAASQKKPGNQKSPADIMSSLLNPSMMAEFKKVKGIIVGIQALENNNPPLVLLLRPGKSDALRGIFLAMIGMAGKPGESIKGMQTLTIGNNAGAAYDDNIIILAQPMKQLIWSVKQYKGLTDEPSLVSANKTFAKISKKSREQNALTIWIDGDDTFVAIAERMTRTGQANQLRLLNGIVDFNNIDDITAYLSLSENSIATEVNVGFKEQHNCLAYNLIRTPSLTSSGFQAVPQETIALASFTLSPTENAQVKTVQKTVRKLTGMDIGREIFSNIEQVTLFVLPPDPDTNKTILAKQISPILPCLGLAVTSRNPAQTRQLLNHLLKTTDLIANTASNGQIPKQLDKTDGKYRIGLINNQPVFCYTGQVGKNTILTLSHDILKACLLAIKNKKSVLAAGPLHQPLKSLADRSSKIVLGNFGGTIRNADAHIHKSFDITKEPDNYPFYQSLEQLAAACDNAYLQFHTEETDNRFNISLSVNNIPPLTKVFPLITKLPPKMPQNLQARAVKPKPANGSVVSNITDLSWQGGINAVKHKVYFGTEPDKLTLIAELDEPRCTKFPELNKKHTYYWRVDQVGENGKISTGRLWHFDLGKIVAWWKFDEGTGNKTHDSSYNNNTGTLHNMDSNDWAEGRFGTALQFDGTDDYVLVQDNPSVSFSDNSFSISLWLKTDSNSIGMIVMNGSSGAPADQGCGRRYSLRHHYPNGRIRFVIDDNVTKSLADTGAIGVSDGQWHYIVAVRDADDKKLKIYIDGDERAKASDNSGNIDSPGEPLYIGRDTNNHDYVKGLLDDIRLYNYALSKDEIMAIYDK